MSKEFFYVNKYTKGASGEVHTYLKLCGIKISRLQQIFNINPQDPDIIVRDMVECYDISAKQASLLKPFLPVDFNFNFEKFKYQTSCHSDKTGQYNEYYVYEFFMPIPWRFIEECSLNIDLDILRFIFKDEKYDNEPTDYDFGPYINLDIKYARALQPYVPFEFELDKYDYWIQKRGENEPREIGVEGEEFIG